MPSSFLDDLGWCCLDTLTLTHFNTHTLTLTHLLAESCRVLKSQISVRSIRSGADSRSSVTVHIMAPLKKRGHPRKWVTS